MRTCWILPLPLTIFSTWEQHFFTAFQHKKTLFTWVCLSIWTQVWGKGEGEKISVTHERHFPNLFGILSCCRYREFSVALLGSSFWGFCLSLVPPFSLLSDPVHNMTDLEDPPWSMSFAYFPPSLPSRKEEEQLKTCTATTSQFLLQLNLSLSHVNH